MQLPSKDEVLRYVAAMAEELAAMCSKHDRFLSAILRGAARFARERDHQDHLR